MYPLGKNSALYESRTQRFSDNFTLRSQMNLLGGLSSKSKTASSGALSYIKAMVISWKHSFKKIGSWLLV